MKINKYPDFLSSRFFTNHKVFLSVPDIPKAFGNRDCCFIFNYLYCVPRVTIRTYHFSSFSFSLFNPFTIFLPNHERRATVHWPRLSFFPFPYVCSLFSFVCPLLPHSAFYLPHSIDPFTDLPINRFTSLPLHLFASSPFYLFPSFIPILPSTLFCCKSRFIL